MQNRTSLPPLSGNYLLREHFITQGIRLLNDKPLKTIEICSIAGRSPINPGLIDISFATASQIQGFWTLVVEVMDLGFSPRLLVDL